MSLPLALQFTYRHTIRVSVRSVAGEQGEIPHTKVVEIG